jgi:retron-type reverse transcriptase
VQEIIEQAIVRKARAVLRKQRIDKASAHKYAQRYLKRTGAAPGTPSVNDPTWWANHPHFNPRYCISHAKYLSRTIWRKLQEGTYEPVPAIQFDIPKPDGSTRQIMAFTIPDSALANVIHKNATKRNINLFSSYSFAYRPDKNVFDAILNLKRSLEGSKSYIIQYDFSKYFDSIDHAYLLKIASNKEVFILSDAERVAISAFLRHTYSNVTQYQFGIFDERISGVPQGSSLSLFLSNAAAHELDMSLERQNGIFVRFADDVVAVTHSYKDALAVAARFRAHCKSAGLSINYKKSPGIMLFGGSPEREKRQFTLDTDDGAKLKTIKEIDYLGHRISATGIGLPPKSIKRIKRRIASIIYKHLFLHRRGAGGLFNPTRVGTGFFDWDLVTCINEIRSYIYGGMREAQIVAFLENDVKPPFIRGLMGFFPLTTDVQQLKDLDGWLLNVFSRAQRERNHVTTAFGHPTRTLIKAEIISGSWYNYPGIANDMTLPSFVRSWRASRKYYLRYGLSNIQAPSYYSIVSYE